jgi:hypothetical protein
MVESVIQNKYFFTKRQVEQAASAPQILSHTSASKNARPQNNCQVQCKNQMITIQDKYIKKDLWKNMQSRKGKITRRK